MIDATDPQSALSQIAHEHHAGLEGAGDYGPGPVGRGAERIAAGMLLLLIAANRPPCVLAAC